MKTYQFNLIDADKALKLMDERNASVGKIIINCVKENWEYLIIENKT